MVHNFLGIVIEQAWFNSICCCGWNDLFMDFLGPNLEDLSNFCSRKLSLEIVLSLHVHFFLSRFMHRSLVKTTLEYIVIHHSESEYITHSSLP